MPDEILDLRDLADELEDLQDEDAELDADEQARKIALEGLAWQLGGSPGDFPSALREAADDEPTLIREDYFTEYARELADELGLIPAEYSWPLSSIDWEHAAWELRMDYTSVSCFGETYFIRSA